MNKILQEAEFVHLFSMNIKINFRSIIQASNNLSIVGTFHKGAKSLQSHSGQPVNQEVQ